MNLYCCALLITILISSNLHAQDEHLHQFSDIDTGELQRKATVQFYSYIDLIKLLKTAAQFKDAPEIEEKYFVDKKELDGVRDQFINTYKEAIDNSSTVQIVFQRVFGLDEHL